MMTRGDFLVIFGAIFLLGWLYWQQWGSDGVRHANQAKISVQGSEYAVVSLFENRVINVPGPGGITVVEIRDGAIRCAKSPGYNRICERAGWLRYGGETAISLPNQVVIQVLSVDPRYDTINF